MEAAKEGHSLNRLTFALIYACAFADRLENEILPALRAGVIVLADRYCYAAFARNTVRGVDEAWSRDLFGFALVPDVTIYLRLDVASLVRRVIRRGRLDYWESGLDLNLGEDPYDSFVEYQRRLIERYDLMAKAEKFEVIDAGRDIDAVPASAAQRDDKRPYDLAALRIFNSTLMRVNASYVDPTRADPRQMLLAALDQVQKSVAEVLVEPHPEHGKVTVRVDTAQQEFAIS